MKNIAKIITIYIFSALATNSANAALFNWKTSFDFSKSLTSPSIDIQPNWNFHNVANKSADISGENNKTAPEEDNAITSNLKVLKTYTVRATAYSSTVDQTDSSPFITASGTRVRDGIIAANFLPFGTVVRIPDVYGDKLFVVEDRMHERYWYNVDIWFPERSLAREFGARKIKIEVVTDTLAK